MTSPLAEPDPNSLTYLLDKDPLSLSDRDVETIVDYLRKQRKEWKVKEEKPKKKAKPEATFSLTDLIGDGPLVLPEE